VKGGPPVGTHAGRHVSLVPSPLTALGCKGWLHSQHGSSLTCALVPDARLSRSLPPRHRLCATPCATPRGRWRYSPSACDCPQSQGVGHLPLSKPPVPRLVRSRIAVLPHSRGLSSTLSARLFRQRDGSATFPGARSPRIGSPNVRLRLLLPACLTLEGFLSTGFQGPRRDGISRRDVRGHGSASSPCPVPCTSSYPNPSPTKGNHDND
jgi:hypothetical protein